MGHSPIGRVGLHWRGYDGVHSDTLILGVTGSVTGPGEVSLAGFEGILVQKHRDRTDVPLLSSYL